MLAPEVIESAEKRVGETICGKWHLDRVIGVGGMAAVYEATHRNRNRVAIKLLHPALSIEEGTRQRFLREGYVANTIRHDGAVRVLDDDVTADGYAFLVMELLKGESVEERLHRKGGFLPPHEALGIIEQLLEVLEAAHDQNVVHRDIKPDNIFLTDDGKLKVLDFGIARLHQANSKATKVGSFMGTPAFCAQEQARGRWDEVDHRTDLYSAGATLFTCLTGQHVHQAETSSEQLALAIGATARSLATVLRDAPPDLVDLVDTSLAYDKEDRFQSARAMRAAVKRVKAGIPPERKVVTPLPPSGARTFGPTELDPESMRPAGLMESYKRNRVLLGVLAATLLAVLIFIVSKPRAPKEPGARAQESGVSREKEPLPDQAPGPSEAVQATIGRKVDLDEEEPPGTDGPSDEAHPQVKGDAPPNKQIAPRVASPPSTPGKPAPASSPSPQAERSPPSDPKPFPSPTPSDEGMFDKRF